MSLRMVATIKAPWIGGLEYKSNGKEFTNYWEGIRQLLKEEHWLEYIDLVLHMS